MTTGGAGGSGIVIVKYGLPMAITNLPATNVTSESACLNGYVSYTGASPVTAVSVYWGATDGGDPTSGVWSATNALAGGPWTTGDSLTYQATGLTANAFYYYRYYATNASGPAWAPSSEHVLAGGNVSVTNTDPLATRTPSGPPDTGTLTIQRDPTATNDTLTVYYAWGGTAVQNVDYALSPAGTSVTLAAGAASTNITITPVWAYTQGVKTVWLTLLPRGYVVGSPDSNYVTIADYVYTPGSIVTTNAGNWTDGAIWSLGRRPLVGDDVTVKHAVVLNNATDYLNSFAITNATLTFTNWATQLRVSSDVTVRNLGKLTCAGPFTDSQMSNNIYIVCSNLAVDTGGSIDADSRGYAGAFNAPGYGPGGAGHLNGVFGSYGGGGYGGKGGDTRYPTYVGGVAYGAATAPLEPGSGGWGFTSYGGSGGGYIRILAAQTVTINGSLTANGGAHAGTYAGGGSGGGIYITCNVLAGTNGLISAAGGDGAIYGEGSGGGGGRIAVIYDPTAQATAPVPSIRFSALAGGSTAFSVVARMGDRADIGTLYFPDSRFLGETIVHSGQWLAPRTNSWSPNNLTISNAWIRFVNAPAQFNVTNDVTIMGSSARFDLTNASLTCGGNLRITNGILYVRPGPSNALSSVSVGGNMTLDSGARVYVYSAMTNGAAPNYGALVSVAGDLALGANCWIYPISHGTNGGSPYFSMRNLTIVTNSGFNADTYGYEGGLNIPGYGPGGAGRTNGVYGSYGGGGYGGKGGDYSYPTYVGGVTYGSSNAPTDPGSAGWNFTAYGSSGGGLVRINAKSAVTLAGTLTANGQAHVSGYGGGGSGGGIYVTARIFTGSNAWISAQGGIASIYAQGSGGGGGRIAIWRGSGNFSGYVSATGGLGNVSNGDNGTIVWGVIRPAGTMFHIK